MVFERTVTVANGCRKRASQTGIANGHHQQFIQRANSISFIFYSSPDLARPPPPLQLSRCQFQQQLRTPLSPNPIITHEKIRPYDLVNLGLHPFIPITVAVILTDYKIFKQQEKKDGTFLRAKGSSSRTATLEGPRAILVLLPYTFHCLRLTRASLVIFCLVLIGKLLPEQKPGKGTRGFLTPTVHVMFSVISTRLYGYVFVSYVNRKQLLIII